MWAGLLIGLGLVLIISKFSTSWKLRMTTHEVATDITLFIIINAIHGGTGEGVVHAAIASAVVGLYITFLRKQIGYWFKDPSGDRQYVPGRRNVSEDL